MRIERILVTTDFSDCAAKAYTVAASLAKRFEAIVDLVYVREFPGIAIPEVVAEYARREPLAQLAELEKLAGSDVFDGVRVEHHVRDGYGPEALEAHRKERGHDLLVVASHGYRGVKHALLGSFAERVLRGVACPVLVCPSTSEQDLSTIDRIVMPVDLVPLNDAALVPVRFFAERCDAMVDVVHVLFTDLLPPQLVGEFDPVSGDSWSRAHEAVRTQLERWVDEHLEGLRTEIFVPKGHPARIVAKHVEEKNADLVVLSTHARGKLDHLLLGSVAEQIVRLAPCPILAVKPALTAC